MLWWVYIYTHTYIHICVCVCIIHTDRFAPSFSTPTGIFLDVFFTYHPSKLALNQENNKRDRNKFIHFLITIKFFFPLHFLCCLQPLDNFYFKPFSIMKLFRLKDYLKTWKGAFLLNYQNCTEAEKRLSFLLFSTTHFRDWESNIWTLCKPPASIISTIPPNNAINKVLV